MVPKGAENEAVAQVLQSMASEVGIDLKIRTIEFATSFKQAQAGEFQAFLIPWSGRIDPDGNSFVFLHSKAPQNDGGYSNPEADKALEDARLVTDPAQRMAIYEKLTKVVLDDEPLIYLYHPQAPDRAYHQARGLQADAGRAGARGRTEAEVSNVLSLSCPGCIAARKRCDAKPGPTVRTWVPVQQRSVARCAAPGTRMKPC